MLFCSKKGLYSYRTKIGIVYCSFNTSVAYSIEVSTFTFPERFLYCCAPTFWGKTVGGFAISLGAFPLLHVNPLRYRYPRWSLRCALVNEIWEFSFPTPGIGRLPTHCSYWTALSIGRSFKPPVSSNQFLYRTRSMMKRSAHIPWTYVCWGFSSPCIWSTINPIKDQTILISWNIFPSRFTVTPSHWKPSKTSIFSPFERPNCKCYPYKTSSISFYNFFQCQAQFSWRTQTVSHDLFCFIISVGWAFHAVR